MDSMAIIPLPEYIRIIVAGGPGAFIGLACGSALGEARWRTKKVDLPINWDKLVARYRNVVPLYEKY
jgi:hypothetical protein